MQVVGAGLGNVSSPSATGAAQAKDPRLEHCAHEFEATLMAELLKPMQESDGLTGEESDSAGEGSGGALSGFASESLARAISERGGFGIANRVLQQLERANAGDAPEVPAAPPQNDLKLSGSRPI